MRRLLSSGRSTYLYLTLSLLLAGDAWRLSLGWWVFGVLVVASAAFSVLLLVTHRDRLRIENLPIPLIALLGWMTLSLVWSDYRPSTALGLTTTIMITLAGVAIALTVTWRELVRALSTTISVVLALSLLFELFVSLVVRAPILPFVTQPGVDYSLYDTIPPMLYWSRNELFEVFADGRIQGIVGNANNLGFLALIGAVTTAVRLADRTIGTRWAVVALALAGSMLVFTRSGTVTLALAAVAVTLTIVLAVRRARTPRARAVTGAVVVAVLAVGTAAAVTFSAQVLALLGKSSDLTGRVGIWQAVIDLAQQRPVVGWGWVSFWMPWAPPFDTLVFRNGVRQLQAHNVWVDVWFQIGIIGLVLFAAFVLSTGVRTWLLAVDRAQTVPEHPRRYSATSLFPLLVLVALLVQSVAESRLIVEYGWALLVLFAVKTKVGATE